MNLQSLVPLMLVVLMIPLSGCIAAEEFIQDMDEQYEEWNDDSKEKRPHWEEDWDDEEDCPEDMEEENETSGASSDDDAYEDAYQDADLRYNNFVDGEEDTRRTISVDWRDDDMRVALKYELDGEVELQLRNPLGWIVAEDEFDGEKETDEDEWYTVHNPMPGDWTLSIEIDGDGAYAYGVYLDD